MAVPDDTTAERITVFLADDNVLVREGVRALLALAPDLEVVGIAADYDELVAGASELQPDVVVTDIRMPPTFQDEGIAAAKELRKHHPGTGVDGEGHGDSAAEQNGEVEAKARIGLDPPGEGEREQRRGQTGTDECQRGTDHPSGPRSRCGRSSRQIPKLRQLHHEDVV